MCGWNKKEIGTWSVCVLYQNPPFVVTFISPSNEPMPSVPNVKLQGAADISVHPLV
jgi:hypothetical protein